MTGWLRKAQPVEDEPARSFAASCHKTYFHEVRRAASVVFQHERRCRCRPSCRLARVTPDDFDNLSPVLDPPTCQACCTAKSEACCQAARVGRYLTQRRLTASQAIAPSRALAYSPARTRCHSILFPICPAGWPAAPGGSLPSWTRLWRSSRPRLPPFPNPPQRSHTRGVSRHPFGRQSIAVFGLYLRRWSTPASPRNKHSVWLTN